MTATRLRLRCLGEVRKLPLISQTHVADARTSVFSDLISLDCR